MDIREAKNIIYETESRSHLTPEEEFLMIEAYQYLIEETKDVGCMTGLGGYYYEQKEFDLALKYYEMAEAYGDDWAPEGLGYIWYYGRTGQKDYEKAFHYYSKASENGYVRSTVKIADMYKNGYYVEQDYGKYCGMIEKAYEQMQYASHPFEPLPEVFMRLARIRTEQGRKAEAIDLYEEARDMLAERLTMNQFFGDMNQMKWLVEDLDALRKSGADGGEADAVAGKDGDSEDAGDAPEIDLYDLFLILSKPCKVTFQYDGRPYEVESAAEEDGSVAVRFLGKWYRTPDDFLYQAILDDEKLPLLYYRLQDFEVK